MPCLFNLAWFFSHFFFFFLLCINSTFLKSVNQVSCSVSLILGLLIFLMVKFRLRILDRKTLEMVMWFSQCIISGDTDSDHLIKVIIIHIIIKYLVGGILGHPAR